MMSSPVSKQNEFKHVPFRDKPSPENSASSTPVIGGVLSCSGTAWSARGAHLRVLDIRSGRRISSWHFGHSIRDLTTRVLCVVELDEQNTTSGCPRLLAVGLNVGLVCLYEASTSRVLRAINVGASVTCLISVGVNRPLNVPGRLMEEFDGMLGVGLHGGDVLLVDLCTRTTTKALNIYASSSIIYNEERPCDVLVFHRDDLGRLNRLKERAANNGRHLAYHVNYHPTMDQVIGNPSNMFMEGAQEAHFPLQGPSGDVLLFALKADCFITALCYAQRLSAVLIGYSFGCWQIWSLLDNMTLLYTSLWHKERVPVAHFALQEPSDDPRTCCYLWVIHSYRDDSRQQQQQMLSVPHAVMYSLSYERKVWHGRYGLLYERLASCAIRFQMDLTSDGLVDNEATGGFCLGVRSYSVATTNPISTNHHRNSISNTHSSDDILELCALSYTTIEAANAQNDDHNDTDTGECVEREQHTRTRTYLLLFDLNQWYLSQMPSEVRPNHSDTYMTRLCVSEQHDWATAHANDRMSILDVRLDVDTLKPFRQQLRRLEEHFRPVSISYSCTALTENSAIIVQHMGAQSYLLHELYSLGPLALLKPRQLYAQALSCGITTAATTTTTTATLQQQRETLLDIALEHPHHQSILEHCASDWADGSSLAVGCALHGWLLEWAWQRATQLKCDVDTLCVPLFDCMSGLDGQTMVQLDAYSRQLNRLRQLFEHVRAMMTDAACTDDAGWMMVQRRCETLGSVCRWLQVLAWLLANGLLPESALTDHTHTHTDTSAVQIEDSDVERTLIAYPVNRIRKTVNRRRYELKENGHGSGRNILQLPIPQLFIDSLICEELGYDHLWSAIDTYTDANNRIYPPPSLQAALRVFLIQATTTTTTATDNTQLIQHQYTLFIYLMLDIADQCEQQPNAITERLIAFLPAVTHHMCPITAQFKLIEAMWRLDRGHYGQAMEQLLDPNVTAHMSTWQHRCIVMQLLAQNQHRLALLYVQLRRCSPARWLHLPNNDDDDGTCADWLLCTLHVRNGRLYDAFKCCRDGRSRRMRGVNVTKQQHNDNDDTLLEHIWSECEKSGQLNNVTSLIISMHGLTSIEVTSLFRYLDRVQYPNREILRTIYTMQSTTSHSHSHLKHTINYVRADKSNGVTSTDRDSHKINGSVPMSVLIHYNNFNSVIATNKKSNHESSESMLLRVRDTCTATVRAILLQQQQEFGQLRGQKRKRETLIADQQKLLEPIDKSEISSDSTPSQTEVLLHRRGILQNDEDQLGSPLKKMKHTSSILAVNKKPIDTSFQMETPLVVRRDQQQYHAIKMETPQSILKKRIQSSCNRELYNRNKSISLKRLDIEIESSDDIPQHQKESPILSQSIDGVGSSVRFDISLSSSVIDSTSVSSNNSKRCSDVTTSATSTATFYSQDTSSSLANTDVQSTTPTQLQKDDDNDDVVAQYNQSTATAGYRQSPLRRKPIREEAVGVGNSSRLQQRESVDRELTGNASTETYSTIGTIQSEVTPVKATRTNSVVENVESTEKQSVIGQQTECELVHVLNDEVVGILSTAENKTEEHIFDKSISHISHQRKEQTPTHEHDLSFVEVAAHIESSQASTDTDSSNKFQDICNDDDNDDVVDIYKDLFDTEQEAIDNNEHDVLDLLDGKPKPMDVDVDNIIEISSNSHNSCTEESSSDEDSDDDDDDDKSTIALNRAVYIHNSMECQSEITSASSQQDSCYDDDDDDDGDGSNSVLSLANVGCLDENIEINDSTFTEAREPGHISIPNDNDCRNEVSKLITKSTAGQQDDSIYSKIADDTTDDKNHEKDSVLLVEEVTRNDDSEETDEEGVKGESKSNMELMEAMCSRTTSPSPNESNDILQMTLTDDLAAVSHHVKDDILCMSFSEPDLEPNMDYSNIPENIPIAQLNTELVIDPLIEASVIMEDISVDPDILTISSTEDSSSDFKVKEVVQAKLKEDNKLGTRRSARLRRDSTSSVASSTSVGGASSCHSSINNTAVVGKKSRKTAAGNIIVKKRTLRSMSANQLTVDCVDEMASSSTRTTVTRSNRRCRSVDPTAPDLPIETSNVLAVTDDDKQRQTTQWLSTIMEERYHHHHDLSDVIEEAAADGGGGILTVEMMGTSGKRQRRSASVDSPLPTVTVTANVSTLKRGRPSKKASSVKDSSAIAKIRTSARTNSTPAILSGGTVFTSRKSVILDEMDDGTVGGEIIDSTYKSHYPKRNKRGTRASTTSKQ